MRVGKLTSLRSSERVQVFQPGLQGGSLKSTHTTNLYQASLSNMLLSVAPEIK